MRLIRTAVPYSTVTRLPEGVDEREIKAYQDWETKPFDPPVPGAKMLDRTWDAVSRGVLITWLVDDADPDVWSPSLALPPGEVPRAEKL